MTGPNTTTAIGSAASTSSIRVRGRGWAYTGAIIGGLVSLAANVAHSFVAPAGAPANWAPQPGAVFGSMVWPILLFFGVEILVSSKWPKGFWWAFWRFGGLIPIVFTAGLVSYRHMRGLLLFYGEESLVATIGPLAVDGLMVMATAALYAAAIQRHLQQASSITDARPTPVTRAPGYVPSQPASTLGDIPTVTALVQLSDREMQQARFAATAHRHRTGQDMTPEQLGAVMNLSAPVAEQILARLSTMDNLPVLNGQTGGAR
jgi:hypothetical protein